LRKGRFSKAELGAMLAEARTQGVEGFQGWQSYSERNQRFQRLAQTVSRMLNEEPATEATSAV
jgi:hypothetical protein